MEQEKEDFFKQYAYAASKMTLEKIWKVKQNHKLTLNLGSKPISDLSPLKDLTNLQELRLYSTKVSDLSPLKDLTNLGLLYIYNTQVSDLSPLKDLSQLQSLYVYDTQVNDLSPLKDLTNLQALDVHSTQVHDLSPLKDLVNLQVLDISLTQVSNLSPLKNLVNLQSISVYNTQMSDLSPLKNLVKLQSFTANDTQVSDLSPLKNLANLQSLSVYNTQVSDLSPLKNLANLQSLSVYNTQVSDLNPLKNLTSLQALDIHSTQVHNLSPLRDLVNLQVLNISLTQVSDLSPLKNLVKLQWFTANDTQVSNLSPLKDLTNLQALYVHSTQVQDLSPLKELTNLQMLDVSSTQVSDLSPLKELLIEQGIEVISVSLDPFERESQIRTALESADEEAILSIFTSDRHCIYIKDTHLTNPPVEIAKQGKAAILRYWQEQERSGTIHLNEARLLIVGQAGAGKTSLRTKLMSLKADLPTDDKTTRGIDIEILSVNTEGGQFDLRIWDFGGQNIQHYAHQFFLSDSVVYVLVRDERKEDGGMSYWLNIIQLLGKNSPILIVQNEKEGHSEDIKELAAIRKAFPKVQEPIKLNLKLAIDDNGDKENEYKPFKQLRDAIIYQARHLPHVGRPYAASYKHLQEALQKQAQQEHHIGLQEYEALCAKQGITNYETMYDFLRSYHKLGISLWFEDDIYLKPHVFLRPKWIINALFDLLYDGDKRREESIIDTQTVEKIWRGDEYHLMHGILLKLMQNFYMCYPIQGEERYLIPQNQPSYMREIPTHESSTRVLFRYAFLPKGFLTRLICRQHTRIADQNVWNNAVIFGDTTATVWAYETYETNTIELIADGQGKAQLLNETIQQLDAIHTTSKFANLEVEKLVPCPCRVCQKKDKPYYFNYDYLQGRLLRGQRKAECHKSYDDILIRDILKEIRSFSFNQIRDFIGADRIEDALNLLIGRYEERDEVILLTSRLNALKEQRIKDINFKEEERVAYNQLRSDILLLLERLEKEE